MKKHAILLLSLIIMFLAASCKKENKINTNGELKLSFSTDTVMFDTVFTSLGSSTRQLMIYNPFEDNLNISSVKLLGGESSPFRLNLDGTTGTEFYDKEIYGNDSLFTFLRVTIDPTEVNNPFIIEDELVFETNGNTQSIKLLAYGQNVNYIVADQYINGYPKFKIVADSLQTTYWTNEKPYVIYGYALINSYGTLHIQEGTKIYVHDGGGIWSWSDGQLIIDGTEANPVVIQGDRLEAYYENQPGQWDRIWLMDGREGADHIIKHAIIRNGFIGIQAESFMKATQNCLRIDNTIIENNTGWGIYSVLYAIEAKNTVIANCGKYAFSALAGGDYRFVHATLANNWNMSTRNTPSLYLRNFEQDSLGSIYTYPLHFEMDNSILYGNLDNEISMELSGTDTTYVFDHCLLKSKRFSNSSAGYVNCIFNKDPMYVDYNNFDFHIDSILSPVVGMGNPIFANEVPFDLDHVNRLGVPDIGAYQFVPSSSKRRW